MNIIVVKNASDYPTDEITPLLRVAWKAAVDATITKPTQKYAVGFGRTRSGTWYFKWTRSNWGQGTSASLSFAAPDKGRFPTQVDRTPVLNMNEAIVAVTAWAFISMMGYKHLARSVTRDAVQALRSDAEAIQAKIDAIRQHKADKVGDTFAKQVFADMEQKTYAFKVSKVEKLEKVWQRKLKLATTKLRTLARRKAALRAAQTRKQQSGSLVTA